MDATTHGITPGIDTPAHVDESRLRMLADSLHCMTEQDFMLLTNCTGHTVESWRKRGKGPEYILAGNRYFYARQSVADFLEYCTRQRSQSLGTRVRQLRA
jgi:hypothetical protein